MPLNREPKSVIVWLNYNSSKILNIVLRSLESLAELDYEDHLVLVVDNGSTDGSIDEIKRFIENNPELRRRTKVLELDHNLGFPGAHNIVWRYVLKKFPSSRFFVTVNNDAVLYRESLGKLIEFLEQSPKTCGVQGIIELGDSDRVDSFGVFVDEFLVVYPFMRLRRAEDVPHKCFAVTYVTGAFAVYRMDILKRIALRNGDIFPTHAFAYYDDDLLGILSYINGFNMVAVPVKAAKHYVSLTFKLTGLREYLSLRSYMAKTLLTSTRLRPLAMLFAARSILRRSYMALTRYSSPKASKVIARTLVDGMTLARTLKKRYGLKIDRKVIERIPFIPLSVWRSMLALLRFNPLGRWIESYLESNIACRYGFKCV